MVMWKKADEEGKLPVSAILQSPSVSLSPWHTLPADYGAPSNSTRSPTLPRSAPHSGAWAAKDGVTHISTLHMPLLKSRGLASASGARTPGKREIVSIVPQNLHLWDLSVFSWNDCYCFKLGFEKLIMEGRETSRNIWAPEKLSLQL